MDTGDSCPAPRRVLLCDADGPSVRLHARYLADAGIATSTVASGAECRQAVDREAPDLVLLAILLPGMDGLSLCRSLRDAYPDMPIVLLSVLQAESRARDAGATRFLLKPVSRQVLVRTVECLTAGAA